jgi:hypothetical protein
MADPVLGHKIDDNACPSCWKKLDGASALDPDCPKPKPNDLTVCFYCQAILQFGHEMELRKVTMEEFVRLPMEQQGGVLSLVHSIIDFHEKREHGTESM